MDRPESTTPRLRAVILDLDGVVTRTADVHERAWKQVFDAFLQKQAVVEGAPFAPFTHDDYLRYVDGKPRYDGVESFLRSRGISLPYGKTSDEPRKRTICGLGNRKNTAFQEVLDSRGVKAFEDAVQRLRAWREAGLRTALVSSSRNAQRVLQAAGLTSWFDTRVDGVTAAHLGLRGKPAPDLFLSAARALGVAPSEAIVVEDAVAGVQAGRAGGFALVVGVAREGGDRALRRGGADVVVSRLTELEEETAMQQTRRDPEQVPGVFEDLQGFDAQLRGRRLAVFLDYDGTLSPIVPRPEDAVISDTMRQAVAALAEVSTVAVVSGRDRADVQERVGLADIYYAGSHGFDIAGPERRMQHDAGVEALPELEAAERELGRTLASVEGAQLERKRFSLAIHYRNVADEDVPRVERAVEEARRAHASLRKGVGKKVLELQPDVDWHKGRAVHWLLEALDLRADDVLPVYVGDDVTDEDAFRALHGQGLGVLVGMHDAGVTAADYRVADTDEVERLLGHLAQLPGRS